MDFNIDELKEKYLKKTQVSLTDLPQLQTMVPVLIREICRLEKELEEAQRYIETLESKRPPTTRKGASGKAEWTAAYDMKKNRLRITLKGVFDSKAAKLASNAIITVLEHSVKGFDLINDIRELETIADMRTVFHLKKTWFHLVQTGVHRTVRVVGPKETPATILFAKYFKQGPNIMVVQTVEDAEKALENEGKFLTT